MEEKEIIISKKDSLMCIISIAIIPFLGISLGIFQLTQGNSHIATPIFIVAIILGIFIYLYLANCKLTVTNKRVYGTSVFGRKINLPLDSISAVSTMYVKGICVSTSSGRINFFEISNNQEIFDEINKLLMNRNK